MILFSTGSLLAAADDFQIANVQFIHNYINQKHGVSVPIKESSQSGWAANMKYMLCAVDNANWRLNDRPTSNYCNSSYATTQAVNKVTTINGINGLIKETPCENPCDKDFERNGQVRRCMYNCLLDWESCPRNEFGLGTCGCPADAFPNGNGGCDLVTPCTPGAIGYYDGWICACNALGTKWLCEENNQPCPVCDTSCGCPVDEIPTGVGGCKRGELKCGAGRVGYYPQSNGTILARNCPESTFWDDCPFINNKVPCDGPAGYTGYHNREGCDGAHWGDAYLEYCCVNNEITFGTCSVSGGSVCSPNNICKADSLTGVESPLVSIEGHSHMGVRMVYVVNNGLGADPTIVRGDCRRRNTQTGGLNGNSCQQKAVDVGAAIIAGTANSDFCSGGGLGLDSPPSILTNNATIQAKYFCNFLGDLPAPSTCP